METDYSSPQMSQRRQAEQRSGEEAGVNFKAITNNKDNNNNNPRDNDNELAFNENALLKDVFDVGKVVAVVNASIALSQTVTCRKRSTCSPTKQQGQIVLFKSLITRQLQSINSMLIIKFKILLSFILPPPPLLPLSLTTCTAKTHRSSLFLLLLFLMMASCPINIDAGFFTFYFPNFMKPSGYSELTEMIKVVESNINATKDAFQDTQYFWSLLQKADKVALEAQKEMVYPEESACEEVFPLFRDKAIEYAHIDYDFYMKPMLEYRDYLTQFRSTLYPDKEEGKTILPREWEQKLHEKELELEILWHSKLTNESEYQSKREQMVNIWKSVKRSLDTSLPCIYLKYAYRQISEDINQQALELNLRGMNRAMEMLKAAYKRIEKYQASDEKAIRDIEEAIEKDRILEINP